MATKRRTERGSYLVPEQVPHHLACRPEALLVRRIDGVRDATFRVYDDHGKGGGGRDGFHVGEGLGGLQVGRPRPGFLHLDVENGVSLGRGEMREGRVMGGYILS